MSADHEPRSVVAGWLTHKIKSALNIFKQPCRDGCTVYEYWMNSHNGHLEFNPKESVALCIGIDKQFYPEYRNPTVTKLKDIGKVAKNDVKNTSSVLKKDLGINQCTAINASDTEGEYLCTKLGLRSAFVENARKVGENGVFIFYFAGHGCKSDDNSTPSSVCYRLAPASYMTREDGISMNDLLEWLHSAGYNKVTNNVLFIFDCCYAERIQLEKYELNINITSKISVMYACTKEERSTTFPELENGIFTYFLLDYLKSLRGQCSFDFTDANKKIADLCRSLSSLICIYKSEDKSSTHPWEFCQMNPCVYTLMKIQKIGHRGLPSAHSERTEFTGIASTFEALRRDYKFENWDVPEEIEKWIDSEQVETSLSLLHKKASPNELLHNTIVCAMLHTSAVHLCIESKVTAEDVKTFLAIARKIALCIEVIFGKVRVAHLLNGLRRYKDTITDVFKEVLKDQHEALDTTSLDRLDDKVCIYCSLIVLQQMLAM